MRYRGFVCACLVVALMLVGCGGAAKTPPPDEILPVLANVRAGYNAEDMELFCADFAEVMFGEGYTRETYLQVTQQLKAQVGEWRSETYRGVKDNEYTWQVTFAEAKATVLLVMDENWQVIGLWFR